MNNTDNTIQEISGINYLKDEDIFFEKTEGGFLSVKVKDVTYKRVMIQRAFPLSKPFKFISVIKPKDFSILRTYLRSFL